MMHCAKFGCNWPSGSGEEHFLNFINLFSLFGYYLPLEKGGAHHLNKLESPSPKDAFCQVWLNWLSGSGEEDFFNFVNVFSLFRNYLPLKKGGAHHLNKLESPSPKDALCHVWLKLAQWFWRRWKCEKFTDGRTDRQTTNDWWSEKLTWAFSSGELKTGLTDWLTDWRTGQKHYTLCNSLRWV